MKASKIIVRGNVQGVGFRQNARKMAQMLGISGYVQNMPDGSVEIVAEGEDASIRAFIAWCYEGPAFADVKNVTEEAIQASGVKGFLVRTSTSASF